MCCHFVLRQRLEYYIAISSSLQNFLARALKTAPDAPSAPSADHFRRRHSWAAEAPSLNTGFFTSAMPTTTSVNAYGTAP